MKDSSQLESIIDFDVADHQGADNGHLQNNYTGINMR